MPLTDSSRLASSKTVFKRELLAYFDSTIAYVYASVFLICSATIFMNSFFLNAVVDMDPYFEILPLLLIPLVPAITMRSWAEERAQNTFELLMTLPLTPLQIVVGKYFSALCFFVFVVGRARCRCYRSQLLRGCYARRILFVVRPVCL